MQRAAGEHSNYHKSLLLTGVLDRCSELLESTHMMPNFFFDRCSELLESTKMMTNPFF